MSMKASNTCVKLIPGFGHLGPSEVFYLEVAVNDLQTFLSFTLTQGQFDALISFAHDVGIERLRDFRGMEAWVIADEILKYCYLNGQKDVAAERRRQVERALFLSGMSTRPTARPSSMRAYESNSTYGRYDYNGYNSSQESHRSPQEASSGPSENPQQKSGGYYVVEFCKWLWSTGIIQEGAKYLWGRISSANSAGSTNGAGNGGGGGGKVPVQPAGAGKSTDEIAKEVIRGKYGNGDERKRHLTEDGYDYNTVQSKVNSMMGKK